MTARFLTLCLLFAFGFGSVPANAAPRVFSLSDAAKIVRVQDAQISPDGKQIAVVVQHADLKKDLYAGDLVLIDAASGAARTLTWNRDRVSAPRWSPDGKTLAFVDVQGEGKDAKPQVWLLPMDGGDARAVTAAGNGVEEYAWRPDGKAIAYVSPDDPKSRAAQKEHHDLFVVGDNDFLTQKAPIASHIWLQNIDGGKAQRLTSGEWSVMGGLSWSGDGKYLAYDRLPDPYMGHFLHAHVAVLDLATKRNRLVGNAWTANPRFAPSGDTLAYFAGKDGSSAVQSQLVVGSASTSAGSVLAPQIDRDVNWAAWMPDGNSLAFAADDRVATGLWIASREGHVRRSDLGELEFREGSIARDGAIAFTAAAERDPGELYYLAPGTSAPKQLTHYNAWLSDYRLGETREYTWSNDGFEEDGVLTYPVEYVKGKKYPLALVIHGGPTQAASTVAFNPLVQDLAAHGFLVLQPNYRGSDNLGFRYADAMIGPKVYIGAGSDVVAGVKALEATGIVDAARVGVSGWSGGGWMTSWLITNYPAMWKDAVSGAAVDDCVLQYSLEDVTDYLPALFGGITPWTADGMSAYRNNSPITYVGNVRAATLILSDTGDYRVPEPEAYEFYKALRDQRKTVEFVAIPAFGHFPADPVRAIDTQQRWAGWLETHT